MRIPRPAPAIVAAVVALLGAFPALAVSNRIFMSTDGNNANDCANPLTPCLTFAGALAQVNPGGEVIAEATGGYGALNIVQGVTISGPPGVVIYSGLSVTVNAPGATVVLRGLTIDGAGATGNGINVVSVGSLSVESCVITNFFGFGLVGSGILFRSSGNLFVSDTIARNNQGAGILIAPISGTGKALIEHCRLEGNVEGLETDAAVTTVLDTVASGNIGTGFTAGNNGELNIEDCVSANNMFGINADTGSLIRVSNTTITDNIVAPVRPGILLSRGNNTVEGNVLNFTFGGSYTAK
jgi:hypothetical protein